MSPVLYWFKESPGSRSVLFLSKIINLQLKLKHVDLGGKEHLKPDYLKMNPQHTIPTLDDNGSIIWDSHAICTYLIGKYAKSKELYPNDLKTRAIIDQRLHFDTGILFPRLQVILLSMVNKNETDIPQNRIDHVLEAYGFMESFLSAKFWLAGNEVTIADICCVSSINTLDILVPIDPSVYPLLSAWFSRCQKLEHYHESQSAGVESIRSIVNTIIDKQINK